MSSFHPAKALNVFTELEHNVTAVHYLRAALLNEGINQSLIQFVCMMSVCLCVIRVCVCELYNAVSSRLVVELCETVQRKYR